jgi:decaprenylphospho-beta-D-erythro-pentofuranosid-2-ulose 2-reductase
MAEKILIAGATSGMAEEAARVWAARGARLFLLGRDLERLGALAADLKVRGGDIAGTAAFEAADLGSHEALAAQALAALGGLDVALLAQGVLGDAEAARASGAVAVAEISVNALSMVSLATPLADFLRTQGHGTLAFISSVAGDRGRGSNYVYGASKALVSAFASGLRNALAPHGVHVCTLKPGFVATAMTAHLKQGPLFASAATAGRLIVKAIDAKKDVAYIPGFWRLIMAVIRAVPEPVFKRLKL